MKELRHREHVFEWLSAILRPRPPVKYMTLGGDPNDPCWLWHETNADGYPCHTIDIPRENVRYTFYVHRAMAAYHGAKLKRRQIHHVCGCPACVNPDHLETMTAKRHVKLTRGGG